MSAEANVSSPAAIDPASILGTVGLTVSDLARSRGFYEQALGLSATDGKSGTLVLGPPGGPPLLELHGDARAPALDRRATGLFHFAVLMPDRRSLAQALRRLAQARWPLDGASDHLVSEALYLSDPDGNGIELYRDRPREQWRHEHGELQMATLPLDLRDLLGELDAEAGPEAQAPAATRIGHIHLQVADIADSEAFYHGVLGFDVVVRSYPGALFLSAGGYHHHIGLNTWHSAGAPPPPPGSIGLRRVDVVLPAAADLAAVLDHVGAAGIPVARDGAAALVRDPAGNGVRLRSAPRR
jgi:catechol 2,3-dioxygenase